MAKNAITNGRSPSKRSTATALLLLQFLTTIVLPGITVIFPKKDWEVLIGIARFWHQRATYSDAKKKYVILGVTGPNEYENNVNNNFYTNYVAQWCINYTIENIRKIENEFDSDYTRIITKTKLSNSEIDAWKLVADNMYFPYSEEQQL